MVNCLLSLENIPRKLLNIYVIQAVVNLALESSYTKVLGILGLFLLYLLITSIIRNNINEHYNVICEDQIRQHLRRNTYAWAAELDLAQFDCSDYYDKSTRALDSLDENLISAFKTSIDILSAIVSALTLATAITTLSPPLVLVIIASCIVSTAVSSTRSKIRIQRYKRLTPIRRRIDYISGLFFKQEYAKDIRAETLPELALEYHEKESEKLVREDRFYGKKLSRLSAAIEGIGDLSDVLMWAFLAWGIATGSLAAGDFMALSNAAWSFSQNFRKLFSKLPKLKEDCICANMFEELRAQQPKTPVKTEEIGEIREIAFHDVGFSYPGCSDKTLHDISFGLKEGRQLAIVGENGAGKTTVAKLLAGFYAPTRGKALINGKPYSAFTGSELRNKTAFVFQDHKHYNFSIAEDILMRPLKTDDDRKTVTKALEAVGMMDEINKLEQGIDTPISREYDSSGAVFSGGELQKLALARAFAKNAQLVILDEPSSALDPISEAEIERLMRNLFSNKMIVVISHRLAMTKDADTIIVLRDGQICEKGTHDELLHHSGIYSSCWHTQAAKYQASENAV